MNNLNNILPLSPSKRALNANSPVSSPKKLKRDSESEHCVLRTAELAKPLLPLPEIKGEKKQLRVAKNERDARILAIIERSRVRSKIQIRPLSDYVTRLDMEGIKKDFDFRAFNSSNKKGLEELTLAVEALIKREEQLEEEALIEEGFNEDLADFYQFCADFAELMMEIEDPEVLGDGWFQLFFSNCVSNDFYPSLPVVVLKGDAELLGNFDEKDILEYRSPIHRYSLLHYAAVRGDLEMFLWLTVQDLNPLEVGGLGKSPMHLLLQTVASKICTPTDCIPFFELYYADPSGTTFESRLMVLMHCLKECIDLDSWQMATLIKKKISSGRISWNECLEPFIPLLDQMAPTLGKRALQNNVQENIDAAKRDVTGKTLLHWAVILENRPLIEKLIQTDLLFESDQFLRSPLHFAAMIPGIDPAILRLLSEKAPEMVLSKDSLGRTPLDLALESGLYENFQPLYIPGMEKPTAMGKRIWLAMTNQIELFSQSFADETLGSKSILHGAIALGHREIVVECLKQKLKWHKVDRQGYTPLALAVRKKDAEIIDLLFEHMEEEGIECDRQVALDLLTIGLMPPDQLDLFLSKVAVDTLITKNDNEESPYLLASVYGGPAVYRRLKESAKRVGLK